jgi:flagellar biosynthesis protein FlhB
MAFDRDERTEEATPRHLEDLARKGQVAYSRELPAAVLLFLVAGPSDSSGRTSSSRCSLFRKGLSLGWDELVAEQGIGSLLVETALGAGVLVLPLLLTAFATVALCGFLQVGFSFETDRLEWKWERLDIVAGAGRLFSAKSLRGAVLRSFEASRRRVDRLRHGRHDDPRSGSTRVDADPGASPR